MQMVLVSRLMLTFDTLLFLSPISFKKANLALVCFG